MADKTIFQSAHKGDFNLVSKKLEEDPSLLTQKDLNQRLLLHWACVGGSLKLVTHLIELGSPIDPRDDTETTPLILASSAGHTQIVCLLIDKGAILDQQSSNGHSALQYAASKGWVPICIKLLENGANINITDKRGSTPLHRAASKGNLEIVNLFMEHIDDLKINYRDIYGNSALHLACEEDRQEEALLLVKNGADLTLMNKERQSPLDLCSPKLMKLLKATSHSR
ncbi:26S proteasome non-ATPase regulatory subunit 10-like [Euwallacea fornicatus]|uniref:26S proteasome non-ATPase regulatory subunit 10-like n=1 Tax=Euwallacea fornicatus TaxID=995702 RepID=UPI00338EAA30